MGEIDGKAFQNTCKQRFSIEEADVKALELCSLWQEKVKDPNWHPFRMINIHEERPEVWSYTRAILLLCGPFDIYWYIGANAGNNK